MRGFLTALALVSMVALLFCAGPAFSCDRVVRVAACSSSCSAQVVVQRQVLVPTVRKVRVVAQPVVVQKVQAVAVAPEPEAEVVEPAKVVEPVQTEQVQILRVLQPVCNSCQPQRLQKVRTRRGLFGRRITRIVERD